MPLRGSDLHRTMLNLTTPFDEIAHASRIWIALPVMDYRLHLIGTNDVSVSMQSVAHRSPERLCDCLPSPRVPLQPTRYGVSVQLKAQSWGLALPSRHQVWRSCLSALVYSLALSPYPVSCLMCSTSDEQRPRCIQESCTVRG